MANMLIVNHAPHIFSVHLPMPKRAAGEIAVAQHGGEINLAPGVNEVDVERWKAARSSPAVGAALKLRKKGGLEEIDPKKATGPSDMSEEDAIDLVGETVDGALLKKWLADEKRGEVKAAIEIQIESLDPTKNKAKGDGESAS
jgi:hypothetical protein